MPNSRFTTTQSDSHCDTPLMVCDWLIHRTSPVITVPMPKVTMNGSIPKTIEKNPLTHPAAAPNPRATMTAKMRGRWSCALSTATIIPAIVNVAASERS